MATWRNQDFKKWMKETNASGLSQEQLRIEAMKFSEIFSNVDKKTISKVCFGVQSIKHANVLSEKINFSALGGSKVAIFGGDDLDPLYFEVHMFLDPPDPPYMSKNAKMCYF